MDVKQHSNKSVKDESSVHGGSIVLSSAALLLTAGKLDLLFVAKFGIIRQISTCLVDFNDICDPK